MEIIEELEPTRRGLYGGVVGYLDFAGDTGHRDRDPHRAAARRNRLRPGRRRHRGRLRPCDRGRGVPATRPPPCCGRSRVAAHVAQRGLSSEPVDEQPSRDSPPPCSGVSAAPRWCCWPPGVPGCTRVAVQEPLRVALSIKGSSLSPVGAAMGVLCLAGTVGVLAARSVLRRAIGALIAVAGAGAAVGGRAGRRSRRARDVGSGGYRGRDRVGRRDRGRAHVLALGGGARRAAAVRRPGS